MTPVQLLLLAVAAMFLIGALGEVLFRRTGIPDVLWLVLAGVVLGPAGGLVDRADLARITPFFAALALVVILFQGGSALHLREVAHSAPRSGLLAALGFATTVALVTGASAIADLFGLTPRGWTWLHGALLGTIVGGSSSLIVMPAMSQARVRAALADLLGLESALTDILCVVFSAAMIDLLLGRSPGGGHTALHLVSTFGLGATLGAVAGVAWVVALRLIKLEDHAYPVTLAMLLGLYVLIERAGGSAALGILTVAVILGNSGLIEHRLGVRDPHDLDAGVRSVHQQVTFIVKTFFFVFLGAMLGPPWPVVAVGVGLGVLLLAARVPAVLAGTWRGELAVAERRVAAVALPRGLAAGVLATLPVTAGVPGTEHLPVLVFSALLTTIVIFAVGFPILARRLRRGDAEQRPGAGQ